MKRFILCVALLLGLCVKSPAPTVNFSSPPFSTDFIVNQPGNSISLRFSGVTNVVYIPGTFGYISNQIVYLGTNNFAGGGFGTLTNGFYTNSGPDTVVIDGNLWLKTNNFGGGSTTLPAGVLTNNDTRSWTNLSAGGSTFSGQVRMGRLNSDGGGAFSDGTGHLQVGSLTDLGFLSAATGAFGVDSSGNVTGVSFIGNGATLNGVVTNGFFTNAGPDTVVIDKILWINTNNFSGGGGGSGITALTKDVLASGSGSQAATVVGINGTLLSSLQSGVMLNTFGTGVPGTVSDWPSLNSQLSGVLTLSSSTFANQGTTATVLHGNASGNPSFGAVALATDVSGNLSVNNLNGGSGASPTTFWRGDATWGTPSGGSASVKPITSILFTNLAPGNGTGFAVGDMNGDGYPDFVVTPTTITQVFTNNPNTSYFTSASSTAGNASGAVLGDFNNDGRLDVVSLNQSGGNFSVLTNKGNGVLAIKGSPYSVTLTPAGNAAVGDFNNDGWQDIVVCGTSSVTVYTNDHTGLFAVMTNLPAFLTDAAVGQPPVVGDINGDGIADIVFIATSQSQIIAMTNNGSGVFQYSWTNATSGSASIALGNLNADLLPDIAYYNGNASGFSVYTNSGSGLGTFSLYSTNTLPASGVGNISLGDFNGDGKQDVAIASSSVLKLVGLTNSGTGFAPAFTNSFTSQAVIGVADVNLDGLADVMLYNIASNGGVSYYQTLQSFSGYFYGDAGGLFGGNISVSYQSSAVTPANAWTPGIPSTTSLGGLLLSTNYLPFSVNGAKFINGTVMTANTTATVAFNTAGNSEHVYNTSASTMASLAITLSTSAVADQVNRYSTHGVCTAVTVTGTVSVGAAVTSLTADSSVAWQAITPTTWVRIQ